MTTQLILILISVGLIAGMLSGMIGVGGGIIVVPALIYFGGLNQYEAQGTSLGLLLLPIGIFAVLNYYHKGYIDIKYVALMAVGFMIGGWIGSKISLNIPELTLRRIFAVVLFYTAIKMLGWDTVFLNLFKGK